MGDKDKRYRSRRRLKEIGARWRQLPKAMQTTDVLYAMTDSAHLERSFVEEEIGFALSYLEAAPAPGSKS